MEKLLYSEPEQSIWVEDYEWIGIVHRQDIRPNSTLITPLAFYDRGWQPIAVKDRSQYFRNNGKVVFFTNDFPLEKANRLYEFRPKYNRLNSPSENIDDTRPNHSLYLTYEPTSAPLEQILDWSSQAVNLFEVPTLLEQGILATNCLSLKVYIRYQDYIYGPISLELDQKNELLKPREFLQGSSTGGKLVLYEYHLSEDNIIYLENNQFVDSQTLGSPLDQVDWSLPRIVVKSILRVSNGHLADLLEEEQLVKKRIDMLANLSSTAHISRSTIERAQYIIQHQIEHLDGLQTLIEELPEEHPLLEKARSWEIQRRKDKIEQECEAEQSHLQVLQEKTRSTQETLARLNGEIKAAEQKKEQISADLIALEGSLQNRLMGVRQEMLSLLTDLQLTSAPPLALFQTHKEETTLETRPEVVSTIHQQKYFVEEEVITVANTQELRWGEIAKQNRNSIRQVRACAAVLLAGLIPVTDGPIHLSILQTVAQGITGQRIWRVPIPLTAISPLDIFGRIFVDQQLFLPATGDLADIVLAAQAQPEQLGLVILEGIDRVPFLPVIEPLLRQYRTVRQQMQRGRKSISLEESLPLFHPRALAIDDPYQQISRFIWPTNLLIGVTFDNDASSFALSETYASWFAHIERIEIGESTNGHWSGYQKRWQVSPTSWYAWEKEVAQSAHLPSSEGFEPRQQAFYEAMRHFEAQKLKPIEDVIMQLWPQQ